MFVSEFDQLLIDLFIYFAEVKSAINVMYDSKSLGYSLYNDKSN